jgi:hypothetical protein
LFFRCPDEIGMGVGVWGVGGAGMEHTS